MNTDDSYKVQSYNQYLYQAQKHYQKSKKMIIKIEAEIKGNFQIEKDMKIKHYPYDIDIRYDLDNDCFFISMFRKIQNYVSYLPIVKIENEKIIECTLPSQSFLEEQIKVLQHIESFGAIDNGIEKIDWQNCSIEWIPESQDEEKELPIRKYSKKLSYDSEKKIITKDWLFDTVIFQRQLTHLTLPFSFFREGANLYHNFQYQSSFIYFYLMLEGLFGNGENFRNEKTKNDFLKSEILDYSINETISYLKRTPNIHYNWFVEICQIYNKKADKEGIIHFLVELRGNLSHCSINKPSKNKNPFKEADYHSLAFIAMIICRYSSNKLRLEPFRI